MIAYIHSATVIVSDLERALSFYVDTLGWEKRIDAEMGPEFRFVTVAPPGGQAELSLAPAAMHGVEPARAMSMGEGMEGSSGISLAVEDFQATYDTLVGRGVRFRGPPEDMPWGDRGAWMYDPDGNAFFLAGK